LRRGRATPQPRGAVFLWNAPFGPLRRSGGGSTSQSLPVSNQPCLHPTGGAQRHRSLHEEPTVKKQLKDALHRYKVEAFKMTHLSVEEQKEVAREILEHSKEALQNAYHFHLDQNASPHRVETYQMIKTVALETLLPPVVEKLMRRITVLEHQQQHLVKLLDELMEALSDE
jgi:hypothetical protein